MLDVVANHSSYYANPDFSNIYPFNNASYYHPDCPIANWNDQWQVENCWLSGLPDHDQNNTYVKNYLLNWVHNVVQSYGFDGIRIDTIPEVPAWFWSEYNTASNTFQMGECFNGDPTYVAQYQGPVTSLFNYPMFFKIQDVWIWNHSMYEIRTLYQQEDAVFQNVDILGSFMDNHDNARFLSHTNNIAAFKSAITFAMTARGIPFFYYGDEQMFNGGNDPANRESLWNAMNTNADVYKYVATINKARKAAQIWNYPYVERYVLDHFFAFSKGPMMVLTTNSLATVNVQMPYLPWTAGTVVCNVFWPTQDCQTVTSSGFNAVLLNGEAKIFLPQSYLPLGEILEPHEVDFEWIEQ